MFSGSKRNSSDWGTKDSSEIKYSRYSHKSSGWLGQIFNHIVEDILTFIGQCVERERVEPSGLVSGGLKLHGSDFRLDLKLEVSHGGLGENPAGN